MIKKTASTVALSTRENRRLRTAQITAAGRAVFVLVRFALDEAMQDTLSEVHELGVRL